MTAKLKTLALLDAHAIIHRAYHAIPDFTSASGEPTGALYGLSSMLMKIITELKPDYIVACYDLPKKTFRHEVYKEYKAGRAKADEALVSQLKSSREIFTAFGVSMYDSPGFEADDILGTIVEQVEGGVNIIIASGDMDTMQLVSGNKVKVYTLKRGINDTILYNENKVVERFGFKPKFLPDYKGFCGDPSDNIIGIKGVGVKTATKLISNFGTVESVYKKLSKDEESFKEIGVKGKTLSLIKEGEEEALFSKTLATIRRDAPIEFNLPSVSFWENVDPFKIEEIFKKYGFRSLMSRVRNFFEKNGKKEKLDQPGLFGSSGGVEKPKEDIDEKELKEVAVALWILDSDITNPGLQDVLDFTEVDSFSLAKEKIFEKLKEENLETIYKEIEKPIISVVDKMGEYGVLLDLAFFDKLSLEYHKELDKLTKEIYKETGEEFNINSPKQLGEVLFEKMGIKGGRRKKASGNYSTNISVLEKLKKDNVVIEKIIQYRELQKLLSTYIDAIPKMVGGDKRLHAKFLQHGTTTGRFSSQDPNLQNIPIRSDLGRRIRGGFVAKKGSVLCAYDYSQIELRVAAMLSKDKNMTKIFSEGKDIHAGVASFVFDVPIEEVDPEQRRVAKIINFGIIYGMGVNSLRKSLGGSKEEAESFYHNYFKQFSGVKYYLDAVLVEAKRDGYTKTLFGRKRTFKNINSRIPFIRKMAERTAINAPVQGTAADIIKLAIRFINDDLEEAGISSKVHPVMQIHDELVFEIEKEVLEEAKKIIEKAMSGVLERSHLGYKTSIPLVVHGGVGKNLGEVK